MNRFVNALLLVLFLPSLALAIFAGFDLPLAMFRTTGSQIPYKQTIFLVLGIVLVILVILRSVQRWMGMSLVLRTKKFKWNRPAGKDRIKRVVLYTVIEAVIFLFAGIALQSITLEALLPSLAFLIVFVDNVVFLLLGKMLKGFRVGITSKAVITSDRDTQVAYFSGLRKVSIHQGSIYFDYIKDLQISFPLDAIEPEERDSFFETLNAQLDRDKVFVTIKRK